MEDDDEGFDSSAVVSDDDDDVRDGSTKPREGGDTRLLATDAEIDMVYTDNGFEADADSYESGVSVDDDEFGHGIDDDSEREQPLLWYIFLGLFVLIGIVSLVIKYGIKPDEKVEEVTHDA